MHPGGYIVNPLVNATFYLTPSPWKGRLLEYSYKTTLLHENDLDTDPLKDATPSSFKRPL